MDKRFEYAMIPGFRAHGKTGNRAYLHSVLFVKVFRKSINQADLL